VTDGGDPDRRPGQTRVTISEKGIHVFEEQADADDTPTSSASETDSRRTTMGVIRGAEAVAERQIQITTDLDPDSRATQTLFGCGLILGAIALFLLALVISKYTLIGIRRYVRMNLSLLRGA